MNITRICLTDLLFFLHGVTAELSITRPFLQAAISMQFRLTSQSFWLAGSVSPGTCKEPTKVFVFWWNCGFRLEWADSPERPPTYWNDAGRNGCRNIKDHPWVVQLNAPRNNCHSCTPLVIICTLVLPTVTDWIQVWKYSGRLQSAVFQSTNARGPCQLLTSWSPLQVSSQITIIIRTSPLGMISKWFHCLNFGLLIVHVTLCK